eukprot:s6907_g2.t1
MQGSNQSKGQLVLHRILDTWQIGVCETGEAILQALEASEALNVAHISAALKRCRTLGDSYAASDVLELMRRRNIRPGVAIAVEMAALLNISRKHEELQGECYGGTELGRPRASSRGRSGTLHESSVLQRGHASLRRLAETC